MPTYEYRCSHCGHAFEELEPMSAAPLTDCPNCHKPSLKRLMAGGMGMVFKGSGFYKTDYPSPAAAKADGGTGKESAAKAGTSKTDAPAASKAPVKKDSSPSSSGGNSTSTT